jgi:branched-chain amino acid transport system substrate-binding protein
MNWLIENYGIKRFAMLMLESKSGIELTKFYEKVCKELGVETFVILYPLATTDFYPLLTNLLAKNPDLLFVGADALKQARQLGYTGLATGLLTSTTVSVIVDTAGVDAEGYIMSQNLDWKATPEAMAFHDKFVAKYGEYNEQALTYVGLIEAIIQGIEKANSVDPTDVMLALDQMAENNEPIHLPIGDSYWAGAHRYGGVKHQLVTPIHMMDIHNGEPRLLAVLPPPSEEELVPLE